MVTPDEIIEKVQDIPPLPEVVYQILRLTNSSFSSAKDMVEVMELDAGITTKVLRLCNSAYFGLPQKVSSLQTATVYLGMNEIVNIVIIGCVNSIYNQPQPAYGLAKGELWKHSVAAAVVEKRLASECDYSDIHTAFTAGLLHDLGKIVLHEYVHKHLESIENLIEDEQYLLSQAEKEVLGLNHCDVGKMIAHKWNLPDNLLEAIKFHHEREYEAEDRKLVALTHLANSICHELNIGTDFPKSDDSTPYYENALSCVGLSIDDIEQLHDSFMLDYEKSRDLLHAEA